MKTANHPYLIPAGAGYTRGEKVVDVDRFAVDLATALRDEGIGIEAQAVIFDTDASPKWRSSIELSGAPSAGGNLTLLISAGTVSARHDGKVEISVSVRDVPTNERSRLTYPDNRMSGGGSFSTARPLNVIARDVIRRVIEPAIEPAERMRRAVAVMNEQRAALDKRVAELETKFPGLFRYKKTDDGLNAQIDPIAATDRRDYFYFMGRLSHDGSVTVDRINTLSPWFFADLCALAQRHYPRDGAPKKTTGVDDLVESLRDYVSGDDGNLTKNDFLRMVADRINDDLAEQPPDGV